MKKNIDITFDDVLLYVSNEIKDENEIEALRKEINFKSPYNTKQIINYISDEMNANEKHEIARKLRIFLESDVKDEIYEELYDTVREELIYDLEDDVKNELYEKFENNIKHQLWLEYEDEIMDEIREDAGTNIIIAENLYDEEKLSILKRAYNKYNLDELQSKLNIDFNDL